MVDATEGVIGIEWIEGKSVRALLGSDESDIETDDSDNSGESDGHDTVVDHLLPFGLDQCKTFLCIVISSA